MIIPKKELQYLYIKGGLSTRDIAKKFNTHQMAIVRLMKRYNIPGRPKTKNIMPIKKGQKIPWDLKNLTEEANKKRSKTLKGKFYSRKSGNYHPSVAVTCATCGKTFKKKYSYWKKSKTQTFYCGKPCNKSLISMGSQPWNYGVTNPILDCTCPGCGKTFQIKEPNDRSLLPEKIYCCIKCAKPHLDEGVVYRSKSRFRYQPYYGPNWIKIRSKVLAEDGECQVCGSTDAGDTDHIKAFASFHDYKKANSRENLWRLCDRCHGIKTRYEQMVGLQLRSWWKEFILKTIG